MANENIYVGKDGAKALYKRLKQQIANITTYQKVTNTTPAGEPIVTDPNTRTIYLVKDNSVVGDDKYKEWIWNTNDGWECIGTTSIPENAWKQWSEDNGSSGEGDSVYIGKNNVLGRDESFVLGQSNTVTVTDNTDYSETDIVEIGTSNAATNAANAYQIGRENTVTGNNLEHQEDFPHSMAVNLGRNNAITGEGLNLGKDNVATRFGITLGQDNDASDMGIAIGENLKVKTSGVAIGLGQHHTLTMLSFPSLRVGNKYYPIGELRPRTTPADFHYYSALAFKDSKVIQVYPIDGTCYINTAKKLMYYVPNGVGTSTKLLGTGYIDNNGKYVITSNVPSGKDAYTFYIFMYYTENGIRHDVNFLYTTTSGLGNWRYTRDSFNYYTSYSYGDTLPLYQTSEVVADGGYAFLGGTKIYRNTDSKKYYDLPVIKCDILGYDDNGTFIPWFNNNYDKAVCVWKEFELPYVQDHSYTAEETEALGYTMDDKSVYLAEDGSVAIGDLVCADEGSVAINSGVRALHGLANPVVSSTWVKEYTGNGNSWSERSFDGKTWMYTTYPTNETMRSTILDNVVTGGSLGLFTGSDNNTRQASRIAAGSFGVGSNLTANTQSIAMGENISAAGGSFAFGNGSGLTVDSGAIALESNTKGQNVRNGSVLIGVSNEGNLNGGDLVIGGYNTVGSSGGVTAIGNNNTVYGGGAHAFGSSVTAKYGGMAMGFQGVTAESGAVALGFSSATARYGAMALGFQSVTAENGGVAIGYSGVTAKNRGFAIGTETCTGEGGFAIGRNGSTAKSGGFSLGYNGINSEYGAIAIGYNSASASSGGITLGYNSAKASTGSMALGFDSVTAEYGGLAIGTGSYARNGSFTLGKGKFARDGSIAIGYSGSDIGPLSSVQTFLYYKNNYTAYPVNVQLSGISYVKGTLVYDANGNFAPIEDNSGNRHFFKSSVSGKLYEKASDIPFTDYVVKVMSISSGSGTVPYEITPWSYNPLPPTSYTWVEYHWGTSQGQVTAVKRAPYEFGINVAESGGFGLGDMFYASNSSLAIAASQFGDSSGTDVPTIQVTATKQTITCATDGATAQVDFEYSLYFGDKNNPNAGFSVYGAKSTNDSMAIGAGVQANTRSTAIGYLAAATGSSIAIGYGPKFIYVNGQPQLCQTTTADSESLVIGDRSTSMSKSIVLGVDSKASAESWVIGHENEASQISIAIGKKNRASNESFAIGDKNNLNFNSFAFGSSNSVYGWSIALGVNNTSYNDLGGHATMIGQSNTSTSNQEYIHKEFQIYIDDEPTQEQIDELTGMESAYRRLLDPYLDYATKNSLNTYDAGNNEYYLGHTDEMAWGYYSYFSWLQTLGNQPAFVFSSSDKAALEAIMQQQPQTVEDYKTLMLQICDIVQNYANVDELRTLVNAATTTDDFNAIWSTQLWRDISISMQWTGDPIPGVVSDYDALQQILVAYRSWNDYGLSLRSSVAPHYDTVEEDVVCNSFLVGNSNRSNHYNSILIGSLNESQAPLVPPDATDHTTDDDGFMLAIGYRNVVGRNYDIAIGFKSVANGGENVAIQHSVAGNGNNTFHNLAMFNSTAYGTGNVALQDSSVTDGFTNFAMFNSSINGGILNTAEGNSTLDVGKLVGTSSAQDIYANMLFADSRLVNVATSLEPIQKNRLFSSNVDTCQRMGYNDFFVSNVNFTKHGGSGIYYNLLACNGRFDSHGNIIPFVVDVPTYNTNILYGNKSGSISVEEFTRNIVLQPRDDQESFWMAWNGTQAADNFLFGHQVQGWFGGDGMYDNVIMNSRLTGTMNYTLAQNVLLARSRMQLNTKCPVSQTFMFNAGFSYDDNVSRKAHGVQHSGQNALFNCSITNSSQVFVFGFGDNAFDTGTQSMNNTWRTVSFGDNMVEETCDSFLFGSDNKIEYSNETTVFGRQNNLLNYRLDYSGAYRDYTKMGGNKVFGSYNELTNGNGELSRSLVIGDSNSISAVGATFDNTIIGSNNTISGGSDPSVTVTNPKVVEEFTEKTFFTSTSTGCINTGDTQSYVNSPYSSSSYFYYLYSNGYLSGYQWAEDVTDSVQYSAIEKSTTQLRNDYNNGALINGMWYKVPGGQSSASFSQPIVKGFVAWKDTSYYFDGETVQKVTGYSSGARYTYRNRIIGTDNYLGNNVSDYFILGKSNKLFCNDYLDHETDYTISTGFIQGNNNTAKNGSNIVCMGNGNVSTGHNSTAIGTQLISSQWQTVIGKYNAPIDGTTRLDTENPQDPTKALFIIGNGYSQKDDETYWQDESYITRSNAMVVYADGTVRAKKFVSDTPDLELVNGTGIAFTDNTSTNTRTVSVSQDLADLISFLDTRPSTGRYAINSINGVLTWVEIGTTGV